MRRSLLLALLAICSAANALVIRHDRDDSAYRVVAAEFPALVDLPGEGHGVLIAPRWVVTAAHAVSWQAAIASVVVNGVAHDVQRLVVHPGYRKPSSDLIHQVMATGDATLLRVMLASSDDIALIELMRPVEGVSPVALYRNSDELGKVAKLLGKGATGTGANGYGEHAAHRTELRRAFNTITSADGRWFCFVFDAPPSGVPLEGIAGSGDSGGPALIEVDNRWLLAGMPSWASAQGNVVTSPQGLYGQTSCNVRISHYAHWIDATILRGAANEVRASAREVTSSPDPVERFDATAISRSP